MNILIAPSIARNELSAQAPPEKVREFGKINHLKLAQNAVNHEQLLGPLLCDIEAYRIFRAKILAQYSSNEAIDFLKSTRIDEIIGHEFKTTNLRRQLVVHYEKITSQFRARLTLLTNDDIATAT